MGQLCLPLCSACLGPQADPLSPGLDGCVHISGPGQPDSLSEGAKRASLPKVGVSSANPSRLTEAPAEPAHTFQSSQSHMVSDICVGQVTGRGGGGWHVWIP